MYSKVILYIVKHQRNLGITYAEIALNLNLKVRTVKSLTNYIPKVYKKKTGTKMKVDRHLARRIKRFISVENKLGHKVNCTTIIRNLRLDISRRTLNNFVLRNDFQYKKHAREIILSKYHKLRRMKLIKSWIEKNIDWSTVIFTDEKKFKLDGPHNW